MATFLITTKKPDPRVAAALESKFAGNYMPYADNVWLLTANGTAQAISAEMGVKARVEGERYDGVSDIVVFKLTPTYWGFNSTDVWDWLKTSFQRNDE